jgi:hypothetical protein
MGRFEANVNCGVHKLETRGALKEVPRPKGVRMLPLQWVFTSKLDDGGYLLRCKSRLCTTHSGIKYEGAPAELESRGFTDSDHGGSVVVEGRRSISGYIFYIEGCPISRTPNRQTTIATSSSEVEHIEQFNAGKEALWSKGFLMNY